MSGLLWVLSSKNCSSVGFSIAGAWTSGFGGPRWSACDVPHVVCGLWSRGLAGGVGGRGTHTFADPLHGAHLAAILHLVDGEVDLGQGLLLLYGADRIVDLGVARVLGARRTGAICVHGGRLRRGRSRQCEARRGVARGTRAGECERANQQRAVFRLKSGGCGRPERFSKQTRRRSRGRSVECFESASRRQSLEGVTRGVGGEDGELLR